MLKDKNMKLNNRSYTNLNEKMKSQFTIYINSATPMRDRKATPITGFEMLDLLFKEQRPQ